MTNDEDFGMNDDRFFWGRTAAPFVAAALCLYVGAYFWLCVPSTLGLVNGPNVTVVRFPIYTNGGQTSYIVFYPLMKLDQYFFPGRWAGIHRRTYSPAVPPAPTPAP